MTARRLLLVFAAFASVVAVRAQVVWTGAGADKNWTTAGNWQGNTVPVNNGTANVLFGPAARTDVTVNSSRNVGTLEFDFQDGPGYTLKSTGGATLTINNGLTVDNADGDEENYRNRVVFGSGLGVILNSSQTWQIDDLLRIEGTISGGIGRKLTLSGTEVLELLGANTYFGGTDIIDGLRIGIGNSGAFGSGTITLTGVSGPEFHTINGDVTIANAINLKGSGFDYDIYGGSGTLTLSGPISMFSNQSIELEGGAAPLKITGNVSESGGARSLFVSGDGVLVLSGTNTYTGGTTNENSILIFGSTASIPTTGLIKAADSDSYIGLATPPSTPSNLQSQFIDKFDKSHTYGAIGFDSDPSSITPNIFSGDIDLTGFSANFGRSARIGSATTTNGGLSPGAILTGNISPQVNVFSESGYNDTYRFGGGGGILQVASNLGNFFIGEAQRSRSLEVDSPNASAPLTLLLTGSNTYTAGTSVRNSALIFGTASSLPASGQITLLQGGYAGLGLTADIDAETSTVSDFFSHFATNLSTSFVGFDSANRNTQRTIDSEVSLPSFGSGTYLATTTNIAIFGDISFSDGHYRFAGYKGGQLAIYSSLNNYDEQESAVAIGHSNVSATFATPDQSVMSTVLLGGNNSYSGGTDFYAGRLVIGGTGATSALGSGTLRVLSNNVGSEYTTHRLEVSNEGTIVNNDLQLDDGLNIGGANSFTLAGAIGGNGLLFKTDRSVLTLTHSNTSFSGDIYLGGGTMVFADDFAAGFGSLFMGGTLTPTAVFTTSAPHIYGLSGDDASDFIDLATNSTLSIFDNGYNNDFKGVIAGSNASVRYSGIRLTLSGPNTYGGGSTVTEGAQIFAANNAAFGTGTVSVTSGEGSGSIFINNGVTISNALNLNSGKIGGFGTFNPSSAVVIGAASFDRVDAAPGGPDSFDRVGTLNFGSAGVVFAPRGALDIDIKDLGAGAGFGWDTISIAGALTITSDSESRFEIAVSSLDSNGDRGLLAGITNSSSFSLVIASASGGIFGFDPTKFSLDFGRFDNAEFGLNTSNFSIAAVGNNLTLNFNFTPVPEPSTWILIATGLIALGIGIRKKA